MRQSTTQNTRASVRGLFCVVTLTSPPGCWLIGKSRPSPFVCASSVTGLVLMISFCTGMSVTNILKDTYSLSHTYIHVHILIYFRKKWHMPQFQERRKTHAYRTHTVLYTCHPLKGVTHCHRHWRKQQTHTSWNEFHFPVMVTSPVRVLVWMFLNICIFKKLKCTNRQHSNANHKKCVSI